MKLVLVYSSSREPVTSVLLEYAKDLDLTAVDVKDLLDCGIISDTISGEGAHLAWEMPLVRKVENDSATFLINRAFYPPDECFREFQKSDREYAKNEYWSYLMWALSSFKYATEKPNLSSLTGGSHSLPSQWRIISNSAINISTPEFYFGPPQSIPGTWEKVIHTDPYNIYFWQANDCPDAVNIFAIRREKLLNPVLALVSSNQVQLISMDGSPVSLSKSEREKIETASLAIISIFGYFICEILFFRDQTELTFGMIHNSPLGAAGNVDFSSFVMTAIEQKVSDTTRDNVVNHVSCSEIC